LVTPTYYVYFTSSTIITSAILFRGFKGTVTSIITVVMGFFVICAGVVLLQLSKSAKDVPDTAVFAGDLDQLRTIAEQEQPESEPKADAIRGAAAIVRRFSTARQKWELDEIKRLHQEKQQDLQPVAEGEHIEWDGLRRRRTTYGTNPSIRSRGNITPFPAFETTVQTPQQHPPLGMSHFPSDSSEDSDHDEERPNTAGLGSSFFGSIRTRARSVIGPSGHGSRSGNQQNPQSPMHPVPLTEIAIPAYKTGTDGTPYYGHDISDPEHSYGLQDQKTEYEGAGGRHITIVDDDSRRTGSRGSSINPAVGPTPPPHSARRQFSFQNVFRKGSANQASSDEPMPQSRSPMVRKGLGARRSSHGATVKGATEEERLGLVKGDTNTGRNPALPPYEDEDEEEDSWMADDKPPIMTASPERESPRRDLTPPRRGSKDKDAEVQRATGNRSPEEQYYDSQARKWDGKGKGPPPPFNDGTGAHGAFI
jgi:hypothetical protein